MSTSIMVTKARSSKPSSKAKPLKPNCHDTSGGEHPDHSQGLVRLKRAQGQLDGIARMIEEKRYCVDILVQFRAAMAALRNLEAQVFERHLSHCVNEAITSKDHARSQAKIRELTELLARRTQL